MLAFLRAFARWAFVIAVMVGTLLTASGRAQALPPGAHAAQASA